jgi:hypothetical protein
MHPSVPLCTAFVKDFVVLTEIVTSMKWDINTLYQNLEVTWHLCWNYGNR